MTAFDFVFHWNPTEDLVLKVIGRTSSGQSNIARVPAGNYIIFDATIENSTAGQNDDYKLRLLDSNSNIVASIQFDDFMDGQYSFATPPLNSGFHEFTFELIRNDLLINSHVSQVTAEVVKPVIIKFDKEIADGRTQVEMGKKINVAWDIASCEEATLLAFGQSHRINLNGVAELEINCEPGIHHVELMAKSIHAADYPDQACVTKTIEIEVIPPQPILRVDTPSEPVYIGQTNTIKWESEHCASITVAKNGELVSDELKGEFDYTPLTCDPVEFVIKGKNPNGDLAENNVKIDVIAPEVKITARKDRDTPYHSGQIANINIGLFAADCARVFTENPNYNLDKTYHQISGNLSYQFEVFENLDIHIEATGLDGRVFREKIEIKVLPLPDCDPTDNFLQS